MGDLVNQQSAGSYAILLEFTWGSSNSARYTNWTDDVTIGGNTFHATVDGGPNIETRIEVTPQAQTGQVKDEPWQILMPAVPPLSQLVRKCAFALVTCNIYETDPTAETPVATKLWAGHITNVWKNPKEAPGMIKAAG